jgi:hypothetical protein
MIVYLRVEGDSLEIMKTVERENTDFIRHPPLMTTTRPNQKEAIGPSLELEEFSRSRQLKIK